MADDRSDAERKKAYDEAVATAKTGASGARIAATKIDYGPSESEKRDKQELDNASEWDKPAILKRQAARKAATKAAPAPSPEAKDASEMPASPPKKVSVNKFRPDEPFA